MRLDAIAIGLDPPRDVNVVIEVSIGGEPIKYEMDKAAGTLWSTASCTRRCVILATTALCRIRYHRMATRSTC